MCVRENVDLLRSMDMGELIWRHLCKSYINFFFFFQ